MYPKPTKLEEIALQDLLDQQRDGSLILNPTYTYLISPFFLVVIGKIGPLDIIWLNEDIGWALITLTEQKRGAILCTYIGQAMLDMEAKKQINGATGDVLLTAIHHNHHKEMNVVINPVSAAGGGLAHFALSCSPEKQDWKKVNALLIPKRMPKNDTREAESVEFFLIAIRKIKPGEVIIWFYGHSFFQSELGKQKRWTSVNQIQKLTKAAVLKKRRGEEAAATVEIC